MALLDRLLAHQAQKNGCEAAQQFLVFASLSLPPSLDGSPTPEGD